MADDVTILEEATEASAEYGQQKCDYLRLNSDRLESMTRKRTNTGLLQYDFLYYRLNGLGVCLFVCLGAFVALFCLFFRNRGSNKISQRLRKAMTKYYLVLSRKS